MNQLCVYCQSPLAPGERQCQRCGRWQSLSNTDYHPSEDPSDDAWEDTNSTWANTSGPTQQGMLSRGQPLGSPQRRPVNPSFAYTGQPPRRHTATLKILVAVLAVALVGLGGGAVAVVLAQGGNASPGKPVAVAGQTATTAPGSPTATTGPETPTTTPTPGGHTPTPGSNGDICTSAGGPALTFNGAPTVPLLYDRLLSDDLPTVPQERDQLQQGDLVQVRNSISLVARINLPPANQTITICKMTLRLIAFTPVADPGPNVLDVCSGVYMDPGGYQSAGCGGGFSADGIASFHLTSTQVGASMTSTVSIGDNITPAHVTTTSEGGGAIRADIRVSTPGTYTFSVGLWQNTSGPIFDAQSYSQMILVGHVHYYWGGTECLNDLQQAQMPTPTDTPIALVCPGPAPL